MSACVYEGWKMRIFELEASSEDTSSNYLISVSPQFGKRFLFGLLWYGHLEVDCFQFSALWDKF